MILYKPKDSKVYVVFWNGENVSEIEKFNSFLKNESVNSEYDYSIISTGTATVLGASAKHKNSESRGTQFAYPGDYIIFDSYRKDKDFCLFVSTKKYLEENYVLDIYGNNGTSK